MLIRGILNPSINSLMSRVRHTNTIIIADRGFPYYPGKETIDISLVEDIPRVVDVLHAIRLNFMCGKGVMAKEFREVSSAETVAGYDRALDGISMTWEPHLSFKARVRDAIGIIRTGDSTRFGNVILEST